MPLVRVLTDVRASGKSGIIAAQGGVTTVQNFPVFRADRYGAAFPFEYGGVPV